MSDREIASQLVAVSDSESGQKLLRFLERRLELPQALLHRWIRTGQIRVNGKRCKPFARVNAGEMIRLPPFALGLRKTEPELAEAANWPEEQIRQSLQNAGLALIGIADNVWALEKPQGLPVQSGSGHLDSVAERLKSCFGTCAYIPAPAHRLDRDTGGVLLAGATFDAQRTLHEDIARGLVHKEYLAICGGNWPWQDVRFIRHYLAKTGAPGAEKALVRDEPFPGAKEAFCLVRSLGASAGGSLLQIRLLTGRFNQLRAQLAFLGYPLLGDGKYGQYGQGGLKLHAFRMTLPGGAKFVSRPGWFDGGMALPDMIEMDELDNFAEK